MEEKRFCIICGNEIGHDVGENVVTCNKECRDEHARKMMRLNNENMKEKNAREILLFAESKLKTGCDIERIVKIIMLMNIHNIPFEDFVLTTYYLVNKEQPRVAVTKSDVEKVAFAWDAVNGLERTNKYKKKLKKKLKILEDAVLKVKGRENQRKIENKIKMVTRLLDSTPVFGFNDNANKIIMKKFGITFGNIDDEIVALIDRKWGMLSEIVGITKGVTSSFLDEIKEIYFQNKTKFYGRNPAVLVAGLFCFVYRKHDINMTTDIVANLMDVSKPSVEDVLSML